MIDNKIIDLRLNGYNRFLKKNLANTESKLIRLKKAFDNKIFKKYDYVTVTFSNESDFKIGAIMFRIEGISHFNEGDNFKFNYFLYFGFNNARDSSKIQFQPYHIDNGRISVSFSIRKSYPLEIKLFKYCFKNFKIKEF